MPKKNSTTKRPRTELTSVKPTRATKISAKKISVKNTSGKKINHDKNIILMSGEEFNYLKHVRIIFYNSISFL